MNVIDIFQKNPSKVLEDIYFAWILSCLIVSVGLPVFFFQLLQISFLVSLLYMINVWDDLPVDPLNNMERINDGYRIREECTGIIEIRVIHITDNILDAISLCFRYWSEVLFRRFLIAIGKDINDLSGSKVHDYHCISILVIESHIDFIYRDDIRQWETRQTDILHEYSMHVCVRDIILTSHFRSRHINILHFIDNHERCQARRLLVRLEKVKMICFHMPARRASPLSFPYLESQMSDSLYNRVIDCPDIDPSGVHACTAFWAIHRYKFLLQNYNAFIVLYGLTNNLKIGIRNT
jgi:hypothetical protein